MKPLLFSLLILISINSFSKDKVVYGEDNRLDIFEVKSLFLKHLSKSTAAMVPKSSLVVKGGMISVEGNTLNEDMELCPGEKFGNQKAPAYCSGFLIGEHLLVTAGHCATKRYCKDFDWVFGMHEKRDTNDLLVPAGNIYSCNKVIGRIQDSSSMEDWAIIELDRKVEGIPHLTVRTEGEPEVGTSLVVIGHPSGLPTKIADGGFVRKNENPNYFEANLDTFGGNSGSAVINSETGIVEGILVRGEEDYERVIIDGKECYKVKTCPMDGCRGEDVQKIPPIIKYLQTGDY